MSASVRPAVVMAVPVAAKPEAGEAVPQAEREEKPVAVMAERAAG
jgi:hypothetical protein